MPVVRPVGRSARSAAILLGLLALAGLGACGGNDTPSSAGATVPKATSSTTPADPYAIPPTIDAAYLNKVFAALERVDGDATRLILQSKTLPPEAARRLRAIYDEEEFKAQVDLWLDLITKKELGRSKPNPGDRVTTVRQVLRGGGDCTYVAVARDYSQIIGDPAPTAEYVGLKPSDATRDPADLNPTPWMIFFDGSNRDGSAPPDPCV